MSTSRNEAAEKAVYLRVSLHLLPLIFLSYIAAYLDRVNVGFAKLQMLDDLKFSEATYGMGAGLFFIGYFFFEVPSNLLLVRIGARVWIARIMITWGLVSAAMVFVRAPMSFYILRCLLGVAEAGLFPGIILYLTNWYPSHRRARIVAMFMAALPVSGILSGPLSGWILETFQGMNGLSGWQWLFLLEALPSVLMGFVIFWRLDDRIADANWLTAAQKQILLSNIQAETAHKEHHSIDGVLGNGRVWLMSLIYFSFVMGLYGVTFWLPSLIEAFGFEKPLDIGLLTMIPNAAALMAMIAMGHSADRHRERRWHLAAAAFVGGAGLILSTLSGSSAVSIVGLTLATAGIITTLPLFWSLPTAILGSSAAASGIALVNSVGNLAGFVSPYMVGWIQDMMHSTRPAMYVLAGSLFLGGVLTLSIRAALVNR